MLSLSIARRYLLSRKSHSAVNIICGVAVGGMAIAVMAIVVVLSVFNGFASLAEKQMGLFDPDLRIEAAGGKTMADGRSVAARVAASAGVEAVTEVVEERALAVSGSAQMPVRIKGVDAGFTSVTDMDSIIIDGAYTTDTIYGYAPAHLAVGVAGYLGLRPHMGSIVGLYVPRRVGRINPANPATAFRGDSLAVRSVWQTERPDYDADRVVVPLAVARTLLEYNAGEATAIEAALAPDADAERVAAASHSLEAKVASLGCTLHSPFLTMAFMALPVVPALKITDRGLVDVTKFDFTTIVLSTKELPWRASHLTMCSSSRPTPR